MNVTSSSEARRRVDERIAAWRITAEALVETDSSILVLGQRDRQPVALKVLRRQGDEWHSGDVLQAFGGHGVVRVLDYVDGALLLERLKPGTSLADLALNGHDDDATAILADVIGRMSPCAHERSVPTIEDWGQGFARYRASDHRQIPASLVHAAERVYLELCRTQSRPRLLHGDLHHYNVLLDSERGWLAIDPKGVVGELEYETGAALRNPYDRPDLFTSPPAIARRVDCFSRELGLDAKRIHAWAFAQAVLAAINAVEDGFVVGPDHAWIHLSENMRPMLKA
jgi:streptomycin 6-kinase